MRMRMRWPGWAPLALLLLATAARAQSGGGFDVTWNAIQPGGGMASQGGGFDLSGGLGGAGWGDVQGGGFDLEGGFWQTFAAGATAVGGPAIPPRFALLPCAPNPFSHSTTLAFDLPESRRVQLAVFDVAGQRVRQLLDAQLSPGHQRVTWDGSTDAGSRASAGIYFLHIAAGADRASARIVLVP